MVSTTERSPADVGLFLPGIGPIGHFDAVSAYVEAQLKDIGAPAEIIDPTVGLLARPWHAEDPEDAKVNQVMVVQAVSATLDTLAAGEAIARVTGKFTDPVVMAVANFLQDIEKLPGLSRESQAGVPWTMEKRLAMTRHPRDAKETIERSALPDSYRGNSFRQQVADIDGEHHGRQPRPSLEYGCGHALGRHARRARDAVSNSDWFGGKFYRENDGNVDEFGMPLSDEVRSQQFASYLLYFYVSDGGYWHVNDRNNPWQVARGVYEAIRANHPSRLKDPDTLASIGHAGLSLVA